METVKLSSFDRLINIHQSLELNQTKRINKRILEQQIFQSHELHRLNEELAKSTALTRKILENQIQEVKHKETLKFYKNLSFQLHEFIQILSDISDPLVKKYFIERYFKTVEANLIEADKYLEEISDKVFNKTSLRKINELNSEVETYIEKFQLSPLSKIDDLINYLNRKRKEISNLNPPQLPNIKIKDKPKVNYLRLIALVLLGGVSIIMLFGVLSSIGEAETSLLVGMIILLMFFLVPFLILLFKDLRWRKHYKSYLQSQNDKRALLESHKLKAENDYQKLLEESKKDLFEQDIYKQYEGIINAFPEFEATMIKINESKLFVLS